MANVAGWLFKIITPGLEPDTRPMTNWWAAWYSDEGPALSAVEARAGSCEGRRPHARTLSEDQLRKMGLNGPGDVRNVNNEFY